MKFDNSEQTLRIKLTRLFVLLIAGASITACLIIEELDPLLHFSRYVLAICIAIFYITYNIYRYLRVYNFISFSNELGKLTLRYYQIVTFGKSAKTFEFPLAEFYKYEIIKQGMKTEMIIYRKDGNKIVKYPPVCVNSLKRGELDQITRALDLITLY